VTRCRARWTRLASGLAVPRGAWPLTRRGHENIRKLASIAGLVPAVVAADERWWRRLAKRLAYVAHESSSACGLPSRAGGVLSSCIVRDVRQEIVLPSPSRQVCDGCVVLALSIYGRDGASRRIAARALRRVDGRTRRACPRARVLHPPLDMCVAAAGISSERLDAGRARRCVLLADEHVLMSVAGTQQHRVHGAGAHACSRIARVGARRGWKAGTVPRGFGLPAPSMDAQRACRVAGV